MKINKLMLAMVASAMFASCSDDLSGDLATPGSDAKSTGYMSIAIGMPAPAMSRANDNFNDGLGSEYEVKNIAIAFFTGRQENAKFLKAYDVTNNWNKDDNNQQITTFNTVTFDVDVTENDETLWALALLNYTDIFNAVGTDNKLKLVSGTEFDGTIQDFIKLTTTADMTGGAVSKFFMTNTPYTTSPGTGSLTAPTGQIHLLAHVDKEKIAETEAQAKANPAAEIFVERAVAKVEVIANDYDKISSTMPIKIKDIKWILDNTEPASYVVRNLTEDVDPTAVPYWMGYTQTDNFMLSLAPADRPFYKNFRFVGNAEFNAANPYYRLYFGVDPNGNGIDADNVLTQVEKYDMTKVPFKEHGEGKPQYCNENTFDVAHMDYVNTTRAILRVEFEGGNFYTRGIDRKTMYTSETAQVSMASFVIEDADVVNAWTEHFKKLNEAASITIDNLKCEFNDNKATGTAENEWIKLGYKIEKGRLLISSIELFDGKTGKVDFDETVNVNDVIDRINEGITFNAYEAGVAYYAVRIKHFGDDLTPWVAPINEDGTPKLTPTVAESYQIGDNNFAEMNYLGRYGVLRNNWYQLNVTSITRFGEPTIGDLTLDKTPDDKNDPEKAISCKINILSWAKRSQNVEL